MDYDLPPEYVALRRMIREFCEEEIKPRARQIDESGQVQWDLIRQMGQLGFFGAPFPRDYGGMGAGELGYCILMEELDRVSASLTTTVGAHIGIAAMSMYLDGSRVIQDKYMPDICSGRKIAAFALTEPGAGSDAAGIQLRATREGDSYILDGQKMWITNGPMADVIMVLAITDPSLGARGGATVFVVEKEWQGFTPGKPERKMGLHGSPTSLLNFDEVRVPGENVVGQIGLGFVTFMKTLDIGRVSLGAATLGGSQAALDLCVRWARARSQFGRPIAHMQSVQFMLADMATEIEALRALVYRTAWLVDNHRPFVKEAGMCKLLGSETASRCIDRAVQIHGALGVSRDFPLERAYRDARISEIFEGTNEIQRIVIASELMQEAGVRLRP
jgi:alkylation response protein AidB-like acyl-CoA dehydrogenase